MEKLPRKFGTRYPWGRWFARRRFTLYRGRDYLCRTDSMAQAVRFAAGPDRHNIHISVHIPEHGLSLTVVVNDGKKKKGKSKCQ